MHELSIAMALVEDVERALFREAAAAPIGSEIPGSTTGPTTFFPGAVTIVRVHVGTLSGVDADALRQAFPVAAENTCCHGAHLDVSEIATQATCNACGLAFTPEFSFCVCTSCGSTDVAITGGRELLLESIEVNSAAASHGDTEK